MAHPCVLSLGYYTHISTLADVQENVMEYLHVLSRPMVIDHDHDIIWTEAYMDSVVRLSWFGQESNSSHRFCGEWSCLTLVVISWLSVISPACLSLSPRHLSVPSLPLSQLPNTAEVKTRLV